MVKNRFSWLVSDYFQQEPINAIDASTPDNLQNSNFFTFGAGINYPVSPRQSFTLRPEFRDFYYETLTTDNQQLSLTLDWNYVMSELTSVGLSGIARTVDYDEPGIADVHFNSIYFVLAGQRARSVYTTSLGTTSVDRDNGQHTSGFAGNLNWLVAVESLAIPHLCFHRSD